METKHTTILYSSIEKLPFSKYLDCLCDGDLSALIISGTPTEEELKSTWEDIQVQVNDATGGIKHQANVRLFSEIYCLQIKLQKINIAITVLNSYYVKVFAEALNKLLHSSFKFDHTKPEQYQRELQQCKIRSNGIVMQISMKSKQLQALNKNNSDDSKSTEVEPKRPTRAYFQGLLISLSDHAGRELDEDKMTVFIFCERLKRYNKHMEHLFSQKRK